MKNMLLILILVVWYNSLVGQTPTTIRTPTNVVVDAITFPEFTSSELAGVEAEAAAWIAAHGSSAVRVAAASRTYNCHNYAWHRKDGGSTNWVNAHTSTSNDPEILKKYWDGSSHSYVNVASPLEATVVFYGSCWQSTGSGWINNCDHSAERVSAGLYESKWGQWPRYRHAPNDTPYSNSGLEYYKIPINGNGYACSSPQAHSTLNIGSASYGWGGDKVSISGSGHSVSVSQSGSGDGYLEVSIGSPHSGTTVKGTRTIWAGLPTFSNPTVNGQGYFGCHGVCPGFHEAKLTVNGTDPSNISWNLNPSGAVPWSWDHFTSTLLFQTHPVTPFPFSFEGTATNPCGGSPFTF